MKNDLRDKMSNVTDAFLIKIFDNYKDYQIEMVKAALNEAKRRGLNYNYYKLDLVPEFSNIKSENKRNGLGTAGFIIALISLVLSWFPGVGLATWFLGLLFSFIGVFKSPRGLAIAGLIISLIDVIILIVVFGTLLGIGSMSH